MNNSDLLIFFLIFWLVRKLLEKILIFFASFYFVLSSSNAQIPQPTIMPKDVYGVIDDVSEVDGSLHVSATDITVGPAGDVGALSLVRSHQPRMGSIPEWNPNIPFPNPFSPFGIDTMHNLESYLSYNSEYLLEGEIANATLVLFGKTHVWSDVYYRDSRYILATDGSGTYLKRNPLSGEISAVLADGTEVYFRSGFDWGIHGYRTTLLVFPNREQITFQYEERHLGHTPPSHANLPTRALKNVETSKGWGLKFKYGLPDLEQNNASTLAPVISEVESYFRACANGCPVSRIQAVKYYYRKIDASFPLYALRTVLYPDGTRTVLNHTASAPINEPVIGHSTTVVPFDFTLSGYVNRRGYAKIFEFLHIANKPNYKLVTNDLRRYIVKSSKDQNGNVNNFDISFSETPSNLSILKKIKTDGSITTVTGNRENGSGEGYDFSFPWNADENGWYAGQWTSAPGYSRAERSRRPISLTDEIGRTTTIQYDYFGREKRRVSPEGNIRSRSFDLRGNITSEMIIPKPNTSAPSLSTSRHFPLCTGSNGLTCNKPISVTDAKGSVTEYEWSAVHGQLLKERKPADTNGVRPETTYGYSPFTGVDGTTFYLLISKTQKISATSSTSTTFEYDTSNKFVLKSSTAVSVGLSLRTCFKFDAAGNLVSKIDPMAEPAVCP